MSEVTKKGHNEVSGRTLLRDDPLPYASQEVLRSTLKFSAVAACGSGILSLGAFALSRTNSRLRPLQQLSPVATCLLASGAGGFIGSIYGFNRELIKLTQPAVPSVPPIISRACDFPLYRDTIDPTREDRNPRISIATRLIIDEILTHELGIATSKEDPVDDYTLHSRLHAMNRKFRTQNQLSLHHEVMATCVVGWMILPAVGTFLANTGVAMMLGAAIYYTRTYFDTLGNYKLMKYLVEEKTHQLERDQILSHDEADEILTNVIDHITPLSLQQRLSEWASRSVYTLSRAFPVLMKVTEEEIEQKKYLQRLELEYEDWRKEQGLKPAGRYF